MTYQQRKIITKRIDQSYDFEQDLKSLVDKFQEIIKEHPGARVQVAEYVRDQYITGYIYEIVEDILETKEQMEVRIQNENKTAEEMKRRDLELLSILKAKYEK